MERIVEFYASTEGNVNMVNNTGKVGAVGVIPWFTERLYPILLLRIDPGEPFRCSLRIFVIPRLDYLRMALQTFRSIPVLAIFLNAIQSRLAFLANSVACVLLLTIDHETA